MSAVIVAPGRSNDLLFCLGANSWHLDRTQHRRRMSLHRTVGRPRRVLKYLARYTHRVAISNHRLRSLQDGRVSFEWKDYADHSQTKLMTLDPVEFLRRFRPHVLPMGLVRIRQFGFLANRVRNQKLELCRVLLGTGSRAVAGDGDTEVHVEYSQR